MKEWKSIKCLHFLPDGDAQSPWLSAVSFFDQCTSRTTNNILGILLLIKEMDSNLWVKFTETFGGFFIFLKFFLFSRSEMGK